MPEKVKNTKCKMWGGVRKKIEGGGYAGEGKEVEMQGGGGCCGKKLRGYAREG